MKSPNLTQAFLLMLAFATSGMAQAFSEPPPAVSDVPSSATDATPGARKQNKGRKGFLTPSVAAVPHAQPDTERPVDSVMKSVFDKGAEAQRASTTAVPGSFNTTRGNSTRCTPGSANQVSCEAIDGLMTAHENQRMNSNDTQPDPALQQVFKPAVPSQGVDGKCGMDGRPLSGAASRDGTCWTPTTR